MKIVEKMNPIERKIIFLNLASTSSAIEGHIKAAKSLRQKAARIKRSKKSC